MANKVKWKATYRDSRQNPFEPRLTVLTNTAEFDKGVPQKEVERLARMAGEMKGYILLSVEKID